MSESFALIGDRLFAYASTVYHNSLIELAIFLCLVSLWFWTQSRVPQRSSSLL
jgi:hypothetical protein